MNSSPSFPRVHDCLGHIVDAARLAQGYCSPLPSTQFMRDNKTQQAVVFNLMVIGEAAAKIASAHPEFLQAHPELPWKSRRGMRNRLAHGYFDINLETVWETVQSALPALEQSISRIQEAN